MVERFSPRRADEGSSDDSGTSRNKADTPAQTPNVKVTLSTGSVFPGSVEDAFWIAQRERFDGVEILPDFPHRRSYRLDDLLELKERYGVPIRSIHVPCLGLETYRVWGTSPWEKLENSIKAAQVLDAKIVVLHPPYWWQRQYTDGFIKGVAKRQEELDPLGIKIAVENMYPRRVYRYLPHWDMLGFSEDIRWGTLDVSHAAASRYPILTMARAMGPRLAHVHLSDSLWGKDMHRMPGRGDQPLRELFEQLAENGYGGDLCLEVNTSRLLTRAERQEFLGAALDFVRKNWPSR